MRIGELARQSGCGVETIRYYEREGLLPAPARSAANYRQYGERHAERLAFIRHCRALDMTLEEIRTLLAYHDHPERPCHEVNGLIDAHLAHVAARIRQLQALETALVTLRARCNGESEAEACGILRELSRPLGEDELPDPGEGAHLPGAHG
ncbi:Cd(II)/Pb(II)-responsive transcriptional regulator [Halomonas sp. 328]|uniref:Cd(II)/Pb(II)-responsive transcriptional regulator n=1 Tax=Halomonas sp. 328 TaxID=2776704 RepID=UPI0018A758CE|nr:Cd(II)/Pb(II)-responsive transcriptional regulator [Halomonas sp. 328]MBF8223159.1 Cd(II)/Pb(II)-responsive transcriptional regulator [Halomonas sp. 328]